MSKHKIDLSVLIGSGIDCEFFYADNGTKYIDTLKKIHFIDKNKSICEGYAATSCGLFDYCRPRMNHWHYCYDFDVCPLPEGLIYEGRSFVDEERETYASPKWPSYLVAFKITGLAEGYCWPWELEA